jgi:hypothetical protein
MINDLKKDSEQRMKKHLTLWSKVLQKFVLDVRIHLF